MEFRSDLTAVDEGAEVLLACTVKGNTVVALARPHWFDEVDAKGKATGLKVKKWQSTWDGKPIPDDWTPYAFATISVPDPALLEDDYA